MRPALLLLATSLSALALGQAGVTGRWTTIDDSSGKPRSVVEITERHGRLFGHIVDLYDKSDAGKRCTKCPGDRNNAPIVGLEIIRDMEAGEDLWHNGTILDPETGKVYTCKLWLEGGMLKVRGYVAFLYRTQTWVRGR